MYKSADFSLDSKAAPRRHPWRTLLQARAVENLSYVIGVNRVGDYLCIKKVK